MVDLNVKATTDVLCEMLQAREPTSSPFRVLSVGCGNGNFDKIVFQKTLERFPEAISSNMWGLMWVRRRVKKHESVLSHCGRM